MQGKGGGNQEDSQSRSLPRPFSPMLLPNFETVFPRVSSNQQLTRRKELTVLYAN